MLRQRVLLMVGANSITPGCLGANACVKPPVNSLKNLIIEDVSVGELVGLLVAWGAALGEAVGVAVTCGTE